VCREGVVPLNLDQFIDRIGTILVVLAQNRPRFSPEGGFRIRKALEAICFDLEHRLQIFFGKRDVIVRVVIRRVSILPCSRLRQDFLILRGGISFRSAKHHVLEEVCES